MKPIDRLHALGQSIWYDNIERRLLNDGSLAKLIARGEIRGVTSNPSIFNKAISSSPDYDASLQPMAWAGWQPERVFFRLAVEDIRRTADLFLPLYQATRGGDGYVSLEVNPNLAHDTRGTVAQAKKLWAEVDRPNLMIKIPATKEGIPAVRECIAAGLNINITLIFSLERYQAVMEAYLAGLEARVKKGQAIDSHRLGRFLLRFTRGYQGRSAIGRAGEKTGSESACGRTAWQGCHRECPRGLFPVQKTDAHRLRRRPRHRPVRLVVPADPGSRARPALGRVPGLPGAEGPGSGLNPALIPEFAAREYPGPRASNPNPE